MVACQSHRIGAATVKDRVDKGFECTTADVRKSLESLRRFVSPLAWKQDFLRDSGEYQTAGRKNLADVLPGEVRALQKGRCNGAERL